VDDEVCGRLPKRLPASALRRERYKRDYAPGTLREKLYGKGRARLDADHRWSGSAVCRSGGRLMNRSDEAAPRRGRAWT
jgi:hypothetical protein